MKKLLTILFLVCSISVFADVNNKDAVTMENFEQHWLDHEATIALKNNTNEEIYNVAYRITYLDMNGKALDYKDFTSTIDIEPGMVKKADIPAYEHKRFYQYYKNAEKYDDHPKFKVAFKLKGYNIETEQIKSDNTGSYDTDDFKIYGISIMLFSLFLLCIYIGLYVLTAVMAQRRHRSAALWVITSLFTTPVITIIILLCIGDSDEGNYYNN